MPSVVPASGGHRKQSARPSPSAPKIPEKCPSRALRVVRRSAHRVRSGAQSQNPGEVPIAALRGPVPKSRRGAHRGAPGHSEKCTPRATPGHMPFSPDLFPCTAPRFPDLDTQSRNWPLWTTGRGRFGFPTSGTYSQSLPESLGRCTRTTYPSHAQPRLCPQSRPNLGITVHSQVPPKLRVGVTVQPKFGDPQPRVTLSHHPPYPFSPLNYPFSPLSCCQGLG